MMSRDGFPFREITVLGLGVMGGSFVRAVRQRSPGTTLVGWSPDEDELAFAASQGWITPAADPVKAVSHAECVVIATPLGAVVRAMADLARALRADALVTDVASLKGPVADAATRAGLQARWVGAHPMAGSEGSGISASRADLYQGTRVWLVSHEEGKGSLPLMVRLWSELGGRPEITSVMEHDRSMAWVSHLPQLTANALAVVLDTAGVARDTLGPGGRDMTRLAASSPTMWRDIIAHAPPAVPEALRAVSREMAAFADRLEAGDSEVFEEVFRRGREWVES